MPRYCEKKISLWFSSLVLPFRNQFMKARNITVNHVAIRQQIEDILLKSIHETYLTIRQHWEETGLNINSQCRMAKYTCDSCDQLTTHKQLIHKGWRYPCYSFAHDSTSRGYLTRHIQWKQKLYLWNIWQHKEEVWHGKN